MLVCKSSIKAARPPTIISYWLAAMVHPDRVVVIPLAPEPIVKQDGETKNDCERNAALESYASLVLYLAIFLAG